MPFKASQIQISPATPDESNIELFKKAITKDMTIAEFEMYIMRPNVKQYCHKIIAKKYGVGAASKIMKFKSTYSVLNALRECTQLSLINGKGANHATDLNKGHRYTRKAKSVNLSPSNKTKNQSIARISDITSMKEIKVHTIQHSPSKDQNQRLFTTTFQITDHNGSFIKIPCATNLTMKADEISKPGENKIFNISMTMKPKNKQHSDTAKSFHSSHFIQSVPSYSRCTKEMDYKTFAMIYRIRQRCRTLNYSSMND